MHAELVLMLMFAAHMPSYFPPAAECTRQHAAAVAKLKEMERLLEECGADVMDRKVMGVKLWVEHRRRAVAACYIALEIALNQQPANPEVRLTMFETWKRLQR